MKNRLMGAVICLAIAALKIWAQSPDIILSRLLGNYKFNEAKEYIRSGHVEGPQAGNAALLMESAGLKEVHIDGDGNVTAIRNGVQDEAFVAIVSKIQSPPTLASTVTVVRALEAAGLFTKASLLFVGTTQQEEGTGGAFSHFDWLNHCAIRPTKH